MYTPLKTITPPEDNVRLCVAGLVYPAILPHVIVYVPVGCDRDDCEVPEPEITPGPVIVQDDAMLADTFTVPNDLFSEHEAVLPPPEP